MLPCVFLFPSPTKNGKNTKNGTGPTGRANIQIGGYEHETETIDCIASLCHAGALAGSKDAKDDSADGDLSGKEIIIGNITPVTGAQAAYGLAITNSIQMAIDEINADGGILAYIGKQPK